VPVTDTTPEPGTTGRRWIPRLLGASALLLGPAILALVLLGSRFGGLAHPQAMEHAQIARHVAAGRGFATDSIRPLSLAVQPHADPHPDLYHAPAHPLLLGLAFRLHRPSDRLTSAVGLLLWFLGVPLVYALARRTFGPRAALLAVLFHVCNSAMLRASLSGLPHPLLALLVLGAAWILSLPRDVGDPGADRTRDAVLAGAGLLAGVAALAHYLLFFLAPAILVPLVASRRRKWRALLIFSAAFLAVLVPWIVRNLRLTGAPLFSLYWYEALVGTPAFPGDSLWRSFAAAPLGPLDFLVSHPFQSARKVVSGLLRFWNEGVSIVDPIVAAGFAAGLFSGRLGPLPTGWMASLASGALICVGASCVFRAEPELLLAFSPVFCIGAGAFLASWLPERCAQVPMREAWKLRVVRSLFDGPERARGALSAALSALLVLMAALPILHYLWVHRPVPSLASVDGDLIRKRVSEGALVMTDQPAFMAWHGERRALWLCLEERDWDALEGRGVSVGATYLTSGAASAMSAGNVGWLWWILSPWGVYRDLVPADPPLPRGLLRIRSKGKG
jgi:hypothetical protein